MKDLFAVRLYAQVARLVSSSLISDIGDRIKSGVLRGDSLSYRRLGISRWLLPDVVGCQFRSCQMPQRWFQQNVVVGPRVFALSLT